MGEAKRKSEYPSAGGPSRPPVPQHLRDFAAAGLRNQIEVQRRIAFGGDKASILRGLFDAVDIVHVTYPEPRIDHGIGSFIAKGVPLLQTSLGGRLEGPDRKMMSLYVASREEAHELGRAFGDDQRSHDHG